MGLIRSHRARKAPRFPPNQPQATRRGLAKILSKIKADDGFDPLDPGSKGRSVLVKELRGRNNPEIGRLEECRPVDCRMGKVIALRAGPAAAGPKG